MNTPRPFSDDDLHAYADGALDEAARAGIEAWLAGHADDAAMVRDWQHQKTAFHDAYDDVLDEPLPAPMLAALDRRRGRAARPGWMRAAAAVVLFVAGIALGWGLRDNLVPAENAGENFVRQAVSAHVIYVAERRHAVEVKADEERHLVAWLSKRLGQSLTAPQLTGSGFHLVGGRLVADAGAPAAQFMYEDRAGRRITLYARRNRDDGGSEVRFVTRGSVSTCYWIEGALAFAVTGALSREELLKLARTVYDELES